jgi:hypothetical protein
MIRMVINVGSAWRGIDRSGMPFGATPIGTIETDSGRGILVRTAVGFYGVLNGSMAGLPKQAVDAALAEAAASLLPQVTGARGGRSGRGTAKVRGDSAYYANLRRKRKT